MKAGGGEGRGEGGGGRRNNKEKTVDHNSSTHNVGNPQPKPHVYKSNTLTSLESGAKE